MAWNGPTGGTDWSTCDFSKPAWVAGVMTLSHEEVLHVQEVSGQIIADYQAANNGATPPDMEYVLPEYNKKDWEKCVNGDTYAVIKGYDPSINLWGINANGIVPDPNAVPEEPPMEETPNPGV